jgi:outer membrane receptor protein involved in Fe transport
MTVTLRRLYLGCSLAAMGAVSSLGIVPAHAQAADGNSPNVETVTVTGSRISIQGYQAPTPVTVVDTADIQRDAYLNIDSSLVQLPSVGVSATLSNGVGAANLVQADSGLSTVNLRNLGVDRTLVLFDGQRIVSSNVLEGGVDLGTIPAELVKRVDVVTGGASAAYGSDAVAGVVNLILDKNFTGLKGDIEFGDGTTVQHREIKAAFTVGNDFAGGKGHFIVSADHTWSNDPVFTSQMNWYNNGQIVQNPAATSSNGLPYYIHVRNAGTAEYTEGGLITGNTAGGTGSSIAANSLVGTQFVDNGIAQPFNFGTVNAANPNVCYAGCSANARNSEVLTLLAVPYHATTAFGYVSYDLTSDIKASLQVNYGALGEQNTGTPRTSTLTMYADNAFLPKSVASQFGVLSNGYNSATGLGGTAAAPTQSIKLGSIAENNIDLSKPLNITDVCATDGEPCLYDRRTLTRAVFTLEGALGSDWSWNAYAEHSQLRQHQVAPEDNFGPHYNFAIDSVTVTPTNVGTSGLPIGSIQCRALLQKNAAAAGCVPLDVFGNGVASPAAIQYVMPGTDPDSGILNQETIILSQTVFSGSMQGKLPWGLPAGNVAVAFGAEYRHEQAGQFDIPAINATSPYPAGNFAPYSGQYTVEEGFLEADVPILKDDIVEDLSLNAAGRMTDYSTSGLVETWKLGLTSQVDDNIRLRGTWSLDIRAPMVSELFSPGQIGIGSIQYPVNGPTYQVQQASGGNPNLQPEKAVTTSFGVVLTPQFLPGLSMSLDWYSINVHGGIYTTGTQTIINRCLQGQSLYCPSLVFSASQFGGVAPYLINTQALNAASLKTSGLDVQANYSMNLFDGTLIWALRGNYTDELTQTAIGVTYDSAGSMGGPLAYASSSLPKLRGILSATYTEGPWSGTIQGRFFGAAVLTNGVENLPASVTRASLAATGVLTQGAGNGNLIDNNDVDPVGYLDLRLSYRLNGNMSLYSAVDNATDVPRPEDGASAVYDVLGRTYRVGIRVNY